MYHGQSVSVVFPAYNEEEGIGYAVESFGAIAEVDEVVVVDNNSSDRTAELAAGAGGRVVPESAQGYGNALRRGLAEATGDLVILAEPDGTFFAEDVRKLLAYADVADIVLGTRTTREMIWAGANMGFAMRLGQLGASPSCCRCCSTRRRCRTAGARCGWCTARRSSASATG